MPSVLSTVLNVLDDVDFYNRFDVGDWKCYYEYFIRYIEIVQKNMEPHVLAKVKDMIEGKVVHHNIHGQQNHYFVDSSRRMNVWFVQHILPGICATCKDPLEVLSEALKTAEEFVLESPFHRRRYVLANVIQVREDLEEAKSNLSQMAKVVRRIQPGYGDWIKTFATSKPVDNSYRAMVKIGRIHVDFSVHDLIMFYYMHGKIDAHLYNELLGDTTRVSDRVRKMSCCPQSLKRRQVGCGVVWFCDCELEDSVYMSNPIPVSWTQTHGQTIITNVDRAERFAIELLVSRHNLYFFIKFLDEFQKDSVLLPRLKKGYSKYLKRAITHLILVKCQRVVTTIPGNLF